MEANTAGRERTFSIDSFKPTIAFTNPDTLARSSELAMSQAKVGFVKGTKPGFADETRNLLRRRLLAACIAIFGILLLTLVSSMISPSENFWWIRLLILFILLGGILAVRFLKLTIIQLRSLEIVVFGVVCVQLVMMMIAKLSTYAGADLASFAAVKEVYLGAFCVLVMIYGIFVPNSWKRGAAVMLPMAILPYAVLLALRFSNEMFANCLDGIHFSPAMPMTVIAAVAAIYGTHVINSIRREAFNARQFGQYRLGKKLGSGGMGDVYEAEHVLLKRPCAIKLIRSESEADARAIADFEKEVKATAKLTHWNTVEIFDYGHTEDGTFYYVMEFLPGLSLHELVERFGPLESGRVVYLLRQLCDALEEAHSIGLIHRDIKPANIFVSQLGCKYDVVKLLDFGLVKERETTQEGEKRGFSGTPEYMSPEQATDYDQVDASSDIYSLGCVAYFALTNEPPFPSKNVLAALQAHAQKEPTPLSQLNKTIPDDLAQVVNRCLMKAPHARFCSARELAAALRECHCSESWTDHSAAQWWQSHESALRPAPNPDQLSPTDRLAETIPRDSGPVSTQSDSP